MPEAYDFANDMVAKIYEVICVNRTTEQQSLLRRIDTEVVEPCVKLCINKAVSQENVAHGVCHRIAEIIHNAGQDRMLHVTKHMERRFFTGSVFSFGGIARNNVCKCARLSITWNS